MWQKNHATRGNLVKTLEMQDKIPGTTNQTRQERDKNRETTAMIHETRARIARDTAKTRQDRPKTAKITNEVHEVTAKIQER